MIFPAPSELADLLTPALVLFPDLIDHNIDTTLRLLGNRPERWRPHVKTAKLRSSMEQLSAKGVKHFKCATTLELMTACDAGGVDVVVAYPCWGARARRVSQIAAQYPNVAISALAENQGQVEAWPDARIGVFLDLNPGGDRTGIEQERISDILALVEKIVARGLSFRGLHYYEGHHHQKDIESRTVAVHAGYDQLMKIVAALRAAGLAPAEIITSGTTAFPCAITYAGFETADFIHRVSAGTMLYNDMTSLSELPLEWGYQPAVMVATTVVSHPVDGIFTCDAGHKTVSADAGVPTCSVEGWPELEPQKPSEEHLPIRVPPGAHAPQLGDLLYLVPRHVCPTVNNFDHAVLMRDGHITDVVPVTARGREAPLILREPAGRG